MKRVFFPINLEDDSSTSSASAPPLSREEILSAFDFSQPLNTMTPVVTIHPPPETPYPMASSSSARSTSPTFSSSTFDGAGTSNSMALRPLIISPSASHSTTFFPPNTSTALSLATPSGLSLLTPSALIPSTLTPQQNASLHSLSFLLHLQSQHKLTNLQSEYSLIKQDVSQGKSIVSSLQSQLSSFSNQLSNFHGDLDILFTSFAKQEKEISTLKESIGKQEKELENQKKEVDEKFERHEQMIKKQNDELQKLMNIRFRFDFAVDSAISFVSFYLANHTLVKFLSQILITMLNIRGWANDKRKKNIASASMQLVVFVFIFRKLRNVAQENGLHNGVGNFSNYYKVVKKTVGNSIQSAPAFLSSAAAAATNSETPACSADPSTPDYIPDDSCPASSSSSSSSSTSSSSSSSSLDSVSSFLSTGLNAMSTTVQASYHVCNALWSTSAFALNGGLAVVRGISAFELENDNNESAETETNGKPDGNKKTAPSAT